MPSDPTFWQNMGFNGASAAGLTGIDTRPYTLLSQGTSVMAEKVLEDAARLFPEYDGITSKALPEPANYANPSLEDFIGWHTAHQIQYLKEQSPNWAQGDLRALTFTDATGSDIEDAFLLSADGRRVIRILTLQAHEIAQLPLRDQERLAELPAFLKLHANPMGLWPAEESAQFGGVRPPTTVAEARLRIETDMIKPFEEQVRLSGRFNESRRTEPVTEGNVSEIYPNLFLDQIDILRARLSIMAVFNPDVILQMIADLKKRFDRIETYATVVAPVGPDYITRLTASANSTDGLAGVKRAISVFLQSEVRLRDIANTAATVAFSGVYNGRNVDTPLMVFLFQAQESYADEADAKARSEELNQMKALIDAYTRMQDLVNQTLRTFKPVQFQEANANNPDAVEQKSFLDKPTTMALTDLTANDMLIVSMFDRLSVTANDNKFLPIETSANAPRAQFAITNGPALGGLPAYTQQEWDLFSKDLAKISKVLSSDSQARMDQINRISKEKNRAYELATETVNKMTDILRSIVN